MDPVTRWLVLLIPVLSPALQTAAGLDFLEIRDRPKNYFYSPGMYYPPSRTLEKCTSNAYRRTGICTTMSGCPMYGGAPSGWCGYADILCCVLIASCNRVVSLNNTYVLNPGYPKQINKSIECTLEVRIIPKNVKQIRLEFINFHLAPPNTTTGECTTDILIITGGTKMDLGICGSFTGQHLYYDVNGDIMFNFTLGKANFNRLWEINIIQLEAQQQAPAACLQYIQQSAGMFYTMNYMLNGIHVMSYDFYLICIRRAKNMCSLVSSSCDGNVYHSFMVLKNSNNKSTRTFDFMVQFGPNGPSKIPMLNNGMCIRFEQKEQCMV